MEKRNEGFFFYLATSQRPVAAPGERLSPVVGGVDDDAVAVVSVLPQGVGDVVHRLVHRGHHGSQLPPGDVGHVSVGVDVGLWRLQWCVNRLQEKTNTVLCYFKSSEDARPPSPNKAFNHPGGTQDKRQKLQTLVWIDV